MHRRQEQNTAEVVLTVDVFMNKESCVNTTQNVALKSQEDATLDTVEQGRDKHECINESTWQHTKLRADSSVGAMEESHPISLEHSGKNIVPNSNLTVDKDVSTRTVKKGCQKNGSITTVKSKTSIYERFKESQMRVLGTCETTKESISTEKGGYQNAKIISTINKTAENEIYIKNEQEIVVENIMVEVKRKVKDVGCDTLTECRKNTKKIIESTPFKEKHPADEVIEDERHSAHHIPLVSEKVNYALFPNNRPQSGHVIRKDFTDDQLQRYLEEEWFDSEKSFTKDTSFTGDQAQENNLDHFVEISLEVKFINLLFEVFNLNLLNLFCTHYNQHHYNQFLVFCW